MRISLNKIYYCSFFVYSFTFLNLLFIKKILYKLCFKIKQKSIFFILIKKNWYKSNFKVFFFLIQRLPFFAIKQRINDYKLISIKNNYLFCKTFFIINFFLIKYINITRFLINYNIYIYILKNFFFKNFFFKKNKFYKIQTLNYLYLLNFRDRSFFNIFKLNNSLL